MPYREPIEIIPDEGPEDRLVIELPKMLSGADYPAGYARFTFHQPPPDGTLELRLNTGLAERLENLAVGQELAIEQRAETYYGTGTTKLLAVRGWVAGQIYIALQFGGSGTAVHVNPRHLIHAMQEFIADDTMLKKRRQGWVEDQIQQSRERSADRLRQAPFQYIPPGRYGTSIGMELPRPTESFPNWHSYDQE